MGSDDEMEDADRKRSESPDDEDRKSKRSESSRKRSESKGSKDGSKSRSKSRSKSPSKDRKERSASEDSKDEPKRGKSPERGERVTKTMEVDKDDAAFVLGRGGATKRKVARVSGAEIELDEHTLTVSLTGTQSQCDKAEDYIAYIKQQRVGPVNIDCSVERDDFTAYPVPSDCIGFVMGRNGQTLRSMEEEWGVLMFFAKVDTEATKEDEESLCIFGPLAARRGAELKTQSAVEHKHPGYCVSSKGELRSFPRVKGDENVDGWDSDTMPLTEDNFSYALGAQGSTRKKLAAASGCIIEYVGRLACFAGYKKDRRRGKDYLRWLLEQRTGQSDVNEPAARDDCTMMRVPSSSVAFLTGYRGESLRGIERESATFCFTDGDRNDHTKDHENLLVFSYSRSAREHAIEIVEDRIANHGRMGDRRGGDSRGGGGGGNNYGPTGRDESCWDFQKGRCTRGSACRFTHTDGPGRPESMGGDRDRRGGDRDRDRDRDRRGGDRDRSRRDRSRSRDRGRRRRDRSESSDSDRDRSRRRR